MRTYSFRAILSLSLIFSLFLNFFIIPVPTADAFSGSGSGTSLAPYLITTCAQLQEVNDALDAAYELQNDLSCTGGTDYFPLARTMDGVDTDALADGFEGFTGVFDGNGFAITYAINIESGDNTTDYLGLFGYMSGGAEVRDLTLHTSSAINGEYYVGSLVGSANTVTISGVTSDINITATGGSIGGIAGTLDATDPLNTVSGATYSGDILVNGAAAGDVSKVGGIIGYADYTNVTTASFTGTISGTLSGVPFQSVGGIIGYADNLGSFSGNTTSNEAAITTAGNQPVTNDIGMLIGEVHTATQTATGNTARGVITIDSIAPVEEVGGAFGNIASFNITNTTSSVDITVVSDNAYANEIGGFVGYLTDSTITNSSASGDISSTANTGGASKTGGFVGQGNDFILTNVSATGNVTVSSTGSSVAHIGGLIGAACNDGDDCAVSDSSASGIVSTTGQTANVGGLAGSMCSDITYSGCTIVTSNASSTIDVNADASTVDAVGGLVGTFIGSDAQAVSELYAGTDITIVSQTDTINVGGLFGNVQNIDLSESFATGTIAITTTQSHIDSVGGLIGLASQMADIHDTYSQVDFVFSTEGNVAKFGGLIGTIDYDGVAAGSLSSSYASGSLDLTYTGESTDVINVAGLVGWVEGTTYSIIDNFSAIDTTYTNLYQLNAGGILGTEDSLSGDFTLTNNLFDETLFATSTCSVSVVASGCDGYVGLASYFYDATNEPLASWDFVTMWSEEASDYPTLLAFAVADGGGESGGGGGSSSKRLIVPFAPKVDVRIEGMSAVVNGTYNDKNIVTDEIGFEYWTDDEDAAEQILYTRIPSSFKYVLSNLACDTEYTLHAYAKNFKATTYSDEISFSIACDGTSASESVSTGGGIHDLITAFRKLVLQNAQTDLQNGDDGASVIWVQAWLMVENEGANATALTRHGLTGYFGPLTEAALGELQRANDIVPAVGYYGPVTRDFLKGLTD